MHIPHLRLTAAVAAVVLALDQATKLAVIDWLAPGTGWPAPDAGIGRYLRIVHVHNTGVAFGMFQGRNTLFAVLATAVVTGLVAYTARLPGDGRALRVAVGLVAGGAVGNLIDRLRLGHVTDFVDVRVEPWFHWPAFNVADSAVVVGVILMMWQLWRLEQAERAAHAPPAEPAEPAAP
ncbi:MAG: signal peptidase II, partial [Chloroflexi bacterium CFX6]|nr:signal peptidase II [Chloroflexi bacterium CFX6]